MTTIKTKWDTSTNHDLVMHFIDALSKENKQLRAKLKFFLSRKYCPFCGENTMEVK